MKRILFFETNVFTGATRVTRTFAKKLSGRFETRTVVINDLVKSKEEIQVAINLEQPDILFCSFSVLNSDVITLGKEKGLTVVVRQDYKLSDLSKETKQRVIETYPKSDWIISQTPEMKQEFLDDEALQMCKIKVVDNPLDEEDILHKAAEPNPFPDNGYSHFLWVGRKDSIKDLPTLKKAFSIVHKLYPKTDLTVVSDDPNPYRWIKNADCVVISSRSEASPNVLREALFLGTSVVSTDCSPIIRRILPKECIAEVGNAKMLAIALIRIINHHN